MQTHMLDMSNRKDLQYDFFFSFFFLAFKRVLELSYMKVFSLHGVIKRFSGKPTGRICV